jgi:hypothetical protein
MWQPIETAPRDGSSIVLHSAHSGLSATCKYDRTEERTDGFGLVWLSNEATNRGGCRCYGASYFTHWAPRPAAALEPKP